MAFEMGAKIAVCVFIGVKADSYFHFEKPICTIVGSLLGVGFSLFSVIRDFSTSNKKNEK